MNTAEKLFWTSALFLGGISLYQGLSARRYTMTTPKLDSGKSLRLIIASDLHSSQFGAEQEKLLCIIKAHRPDYILLPGDIVDDRRVSLPAWQFLRGAAKIAPCYFAPGNHEYRIKEMASMLEKVRQCGVHVLLNDSVCLDSSAGKIILAGCEDSEKAKTKDRYYHHAPTLQTVFSSLPQDGFSVLLAHRPEKTKLYRALGFDLVVSGHAHGGQVRIPMLLNGLFAPDQGLFPKYAGGLYHLGNTRHLISRGLVLFRGIPRVFNPPEIAVMDLYGR